MIDLTQIPLNLELASQRLRKDMRDDWFPDALEYQDLLGSERLARIYAAPYRPQLAELFDLPKAGFTLRYSLESSFQDRVLYQALADVLIEHYDPLLLPNVCSHRHRGSDRWYMYHHPVSAWKKFNNEVESELRVGSRVLLCADIHNYFENINLDLLRATLQERVGGEFYLFKVIEFLVKLLETWSAAYRGRGIPQNRDASSFLGNAYLMPLDEHMVKSGYRYYRYMDDIRVVCDNDYHARRAVKELIVQLRTLHLNVNSKKTAILHQGSPGLAEVLPQADPTMESIDAAWSSGDRQVMREKLPALRAFVFSLIEKNKTGSREFKFCINRLGAVARCKDFEFDFTGIDSVVAAELGSQPWNTDQFVRYLKTVSSSQVALERVKSLLADPDLNIYEWQSYHLWILLGSAADSDPDLLNLARRELYRHGSLAPMRAGAILYLGARGTADDRARITRWMDSEDSPFVKRAIIVATQEASKRLRKKHVLPGAPPELRNVLEDLLRRDAPPKYFAPVGRVSASDVWFEVFDDYGA